MSSRMIKRKALRARKYEEEMRSHPTSPEGIGGDSGMSMNTKTLDENDPRYRSEALLNLIHYAGVMELFKQSIRKFKGTNCILSYNQSYDFSEKWEQTSKVKFQRNQNVYLSANGIFFLIAMVVMVHKIPLIWFLSVHRIFGLQSETIWLLVGLLFASIDLLLKIWLVYSQVVKHASSEEISQNQFKMSVLSSFVGDIVTILVYILTLSISTSGNYGFEMVLDYVVVAIQFLRFLQIYNTLVIMLISHKYKNYVNLFGFMSKLFIILHICAIIIYSVSLLNQENNWLKNIGKVQSDPFTKYVYSLYFTGTTMFTVGYGDIIPKNQLEMMVILIIQVLGIVVMGYIISEIGHTLTVMRQAKDDFEQDIQNADTICNNYQLSNDLRHKVRNYIVNNRLASEELNVKEQHNFLMKLNEDLRSEVNHVNHLNIIKTSLFFICNWSKKMQNDVSKKLQKFFFSPNERIAKLNKLYIVTNGKIDVYTERRVGNKVLCRKRLKTIDRDPKKEVFSNVYGCTSLFTGKPGHLYALSKDFAVCYALDYNDIFDILKDDDKDFQYFHETKCKLEQETFPEKYQVPNLINNRQHFCPTKYIVLRKYQKNLESKQGRQQSLRHLRKAKRVFLDKEENHAASLPEESDNDISEGEDVDNDDVDNTKPIPNLDLKLPGLSSSRDRKQPACISFRSYKRRFFSRLDEERAKEKQMKDLIENNVVVTSLFEVGREYSRFFKQGNLGKVLSKYSKNVIKNFEEINSKNIRMDWIDLLIFAQKLHKNQGKTAHF